MDDGEETQSFSKSALPRWKSCSSSKGRLAEACEKALRSGGAGVVAAPPGIDSNGSGLEKSVVGRVTVRTRSRSWAERSSRTGAHPTPALCAIPPSHDAAGAKPMSAATVSARKRAIVLIEGGRAATCPSRPVFSAYWKTAPGLSRLSEPSSSTVPRSSAAMTRSTVFAWAISPSIAA
ncbi:hypothetical protein ACVII0_004600 [Sinorhizobium meliloti]